MMPAVPCRIVIFAKAPVPGAVKTRLIPVLGADRAARLAEQMFHHTLDQALAAARQASRLSVEICTPDTTHVFWEPVHLSGKATITPQGDGDLGQRMLRAVRRVSGEGAACVLIGSDCPSLTADVLLTAVAILAAAEMVVVPALDGGYVLLGLHQAHSWLFEDIPWSTANVLALTRQRAETLGLRVNCLSPLADIDEPGDLVHLPAEMASFPGETVAGKVR